MIQHVRIARPVGNLARSVAMYKQGLELRELGSFRDHAGFDGVMLEVAGQGFHFEFTYCRAHPVIPAPTPEDLLVFYVPDTDNWNTRCKVLREAGFVEVESFNPSWEQKGRTFQDPDGYRIVIQRSAGGE